MNSITAVKKYKTRRLLHDKISYKTSVIKSQACKDYATNLLTVTFLPFDVHCCHTGTARRHHVPDRVKPTFVVFSGHSDERQSAQMSNIIDDGLTLSGT